MKHRWVLAAVMLTGLSACCAPEDVAPPVDLSGLEEIRVDYSYGGWEFFEESFTITPADRAGAFVLRGRYRTEQGGTREVEMPIPADDVATFVGETQAPAWGREPGVQALARNVDQRALRESEPVMRIPASPCTEEELRHLARRYFGRAALRTLIDDHYGHGISWTDDYPHALVQVRWRGQPRFVMSSRSQKALMLPWDMGVPRDAPLEADQNWSLPLSRSVQALLPPDSRAFQRFEGSPRTEYWLNMLAMDRAQALCDAVRPRRGAGALPLAK